MGHHSHHNSNSLANIRFHLYRHFSLPFTKAESFPIGRPPVVIGAMGGSGTRVLVPILQLAGFWMGNWVSEHTQDAMATRYLLQHAFPELVKHGENIDGSYIELFSRLILAHRQGMPEADGSWGWKNPRSMWIIPFLAKCYPDMKYIHVIRDGRDMALTKNNNLLNKHGSFLLADNQCKNDPVNSQLKLWALGNRRAWDTGHQFLGENYMLLDYDRLCSHPKAELNKLFKHLDIEPDEKLMVASEGLISPSNGVGRWQRSHNEALHLPCDEWREALEFFGYE